MWTVGLNMSSRQKNDRRTICWMDLGFCWRSISWPYTGVLMRDFILWAYQEHATELILGFLVNACARYCLGTEDVGSYLRQLLGV